ncbi:MAG: hypothetical protein LBF84_01890 [Holosporales bacterium]|jgi:F0F1-type ATP synthase membrane subunit c/vacuolar-type H+-ATPase subunit K|nr:hypothetical protein [Holosporales bacterium]
MKKMKSLLLGVALSVGSAFLSPSIKAGTFGRICDTAYSLVVEDSKTNVILPVTFIIWGTNCIVNQLVQRYKTKEQVLQNPAVIKALRNWNIYSNAIACTGLVYTLVYGSYKFRNL